jgi:hypothetical protein
VLSSPVAARVAAELSSAAAAQQLRRAEATAPGYRSFLDSRSGRASGSPAVASNRLPLDAVMMD